MTFFYRAFCIALLLGLVATNVRGWPLSALWQWPAQHNSSGTGSVSHK